MFKIKLNSFVPYEEEEERRRGSLCQMVVIDEVV
jgi:hypothetical protein